MMIFDLPLPPTSANPFLWQLTIGDDWDFGYTFTNPDGTPVNLTGGLPQALLFAKDLQQPVLQMVDLSSGVTVINAVAGQVVFSAKRALTATFRAAGADRGYPTRIQVMLQDSLGKLRTYKVDPIEVSDARFQRIGPIPVVVPTPILAPIPATT